ncbi:MAG: response regulator [Methanomicrobiales archaeon]|nr:response regulator [Methanomicrobiales archaeon]
MRILLIDDNEKLCVLYQQVLTKGGHETDYLTDPTKALDTIRNTKPELILLDIIQEPISGWDVLEQVRSDPEYFQIPIIILTGKVLTTDEAIRYGLKIEGFIMKPLERNMLLAAISEMKELLDESEDMYERALSAGMSPEKASECRNSTKKKRILKFLEETLSKQEKILAGEEYGRPDILQNLDVLRDLITRELLKINKIIQDCP